MKLQATSHWPIGMQAPSCDDNTTGNQLCPPPPPPPPPYSFTVLCGIPILETLKTPKTRRLEKQPISRLHRHLQQPLQVQSATPLAHRLDVDRVPLDKLDLDLCRFAPSPERRLVPRGVAVAVLRAVADLGRLLERRRLVHAVGEPGPVGVADDFHGVVGVLTAQRERVDEVLEAELRVFVVYARGAAARF
ncbi:hypothetical protein PG996_009275 [Apiospora saccharicola]|uniref:Uncharacterized protein n=1 Tax=Apiospora saccharicola TaxID=335842 RepID=A0ABR1UMQ6_9PEZI